MNDAAVNDAITKALDGPEPADSQVHALIAVACALQNIADAVRDAARLNVRDGGADAA